MSESLPVDVIVTELSDGGVRYRMPLRKRGWFVWAGLVHIAGALVGVTFLSFWLYAVGLHVPWNAPLQGPEGVLAIFFAFGCVMFGMVLWMGSQGVTRLIGHSEIEVRGDTLYGYECWGPLRWGWRRCVTRLIRLEVCDVSVEKGSVKTYATPAAAAEYNAIVPRWEGESDKPPGKRKQLAWGYPRAWLVPLAEDLARRCRLASEERASMIAASPQPIPVTSEPMPNAAGFVEHLSQPPGSRAVVEATPGSLRLTLDRKTELAIEGDQLRVRYRKGLRSRSAAWSREQLADIRVGSIVDSEGPDTPLLLIRPHPGEGELVRLPIKDEAEARWLATLLRQGLQLPDGDWQKPGGPFAERSEQPDGSFVVCQRIDNGLVARVGPNGILHPANRGHYLSFVVIAAFAAALAAALYAWPNNDLFRMIGLLPIQIALALVVLLAGAALVHAIYVTRSWLVLTVTGDSLRVVETTLFGSSERYWLQTSLADVRVGSQISKFVPRHLRQSLVDSGNLPWELQIHLEHGEVVGFLTGYPPEELQWLATVLRRALDLPRQSGR